MSHELRTPLNSLLILSQQLASNPQGNLDAKQVKFAETIHDAGSDLLELINEILDLAKIESGTMNVDISAVSLESLADYVDRTFRGTAEEKGLQLDIHLEPDLPASILTDDMRLRQVLRNLLSNACKFTEQGRVELRVSRAARDGRIAFAVVDTGIGIPADQHRLIFESFQQADGGTNRKYGGTGLGLSISREIAILLGGELTVKSEPGVGSTFTLTLPLEYVKPATQVATPARPTPAAAMQALAVAHSVAATAISDRSPERGAHLEHVLLVIEDDAMFGDVLVELATEWGFTGVLASSGQRGLELARELQPEAITLDLRLPDMDGWVVLDRLKRDPDTRHIPVHIISAADDEHRGLEGGAIAFRRKPASREHLGAALSEIRTFLDRRVKKLLVVEDDDRQRDSILELVGEDDIEVVAVGSGEEALAALDKDTFDCMVLDLKLPGISGFDLMRAVKEREGGLRRLPIIVYTGQELSKPEETQLRGLADTIIVKDVRSPERLLDETALFLHRVQQKLPEPKREVLRRLAKADPFLDGRRVLVVDDDIRNIFAVTALLEQHGMNVSYAETGQDAIDRLLAEPGIDLVLMDIMMPEMDGYEATRRIRAHSGIAEIPIIALTAKAMKGDREKCIQAGASDYITKPIDADQLVSLLRVWLYK
jgi:CheY-like chemotaxis protein/two-component sensor histidine kinase